MKNNFNNLLLPSTSNHKYYLVLFVLWPFLSFLVAIFNFSQKQARNVIYMFLVYYGLSFVVSSIFLDSARSVMHLKATSLLSFSEFLNVVGGLYTDTKVDLYEPLVTFIVSRFTTYGGVLFAFYAAVFGFFYLKSLKLLFENAKEKLGWNALIMILFFAMLNPIWAINGVRFYTATWIFFYGAYHVVLYRDAKYLLIALSASLVHFSFISANGILLVYFVAGNRNLLYLPFVILSFIMPKLFASVFELMALRLGGGLQDRFEIYSNENVIIARSESAEQSIWYMKLGDELVFYFLLAALIFIKIRFGYLMKEKREQNIYSFTLLFLSFVNFGMYIPSFGGRFQLIFFMFAVLYVFFFLLKCPANKVNGLMLVGLFPILLYSAIGFRQGFDTINAWILAPGLGLPLFTEGIPLIEMLRR